MTSTESGPAETDERSTAQLSQHELSVLRYYDEWDEFYRSMREFHVALFDPGQAPDELGASHSEMVELRAEGMRRLTDAVTGPAEIGPGDHVVDAGCGFGVDAMHVARKRGCRVTGLNIVRSQLELAREDAEKAGLATQVDFRWANCSQHLPFEDASVDVVYTTEAACHFRDRGRFLSEVRRILKPGGRLAHEDFTTPDGLTVEEYREHVEPFCRAWALHSLESRSSLERKLEAAGLTLVEYAGFDGADAYNLRIAEMQHKVSALQLLNGAAPGPPGWHQAMATLAMGWRGGQILHERLLARKP